MFSSTAEYALRAMLHLATHHGRACTATEVSSSTQVPPGYASKVLQDLVRAGLAHSQRGPNGGFTLAKDPQGISILDVINAVDPLERIHGCPLRLAEHSSRLCRLHQRLDDTIAQVEKSLRQTSISEMIDPAPVSGECVFPSIAARRSAPAAPPDDRKRAAT